MRPPTNQISDQANTRLVPMTAVMRAMWLREQLDPGGIVNVLSFALRLTAPVDVGLFRAAIGEVVARHEVLRSTVEVVDGEPFLRFHEGAEVSLETVDLDGSDDDALAAFIRERSLAPIDLANGPLCRFLLVDDGRDGPLFVPNAHHLVSDMWSFTMMVGEICAEYVRLSSGEPAKRRRTRSSFADHVAAERSYLASEQADRDRDFWLAQMTGFGDTFEIPTDRPRTSSTRRLGAVVAVELGEERSERIRSFAKRLGVAPFDVVLTAYAATLARATRRDDVAVATVRAARSARTARVQGCFVEPSVLRLRHEADLSFADAVAVTARLRQEVAEHERFPLQALMEADPARPAGRVYTTVSFQWQKTSGRIADARVSAASTLGRRGVVGDVGGLSVSTEYFGNRVAPSDLTALVAEIERSFTLSLEYPIDLFDENTISTFAEAVVAVVDDGTGRPDADVGRLALSGDEERAALVSRWRSRVRDGVGPDDPRTIIDLIADSTAERPDATAVRWLDQAIDYRSLASRTAELADRLRRRGVGPDSLVGVHVERGIDMVVAVLGVIEAGAAFVPLDPDDPAERRAFMVDDADLDALVCDRRADVEMVLSQRPGDRDVDVVPVRAERRGDAVGGATGSGAERRVVADDLVYAYFTSGSTGRPKAVGIEHRSLVNLVSAMRERPGIASSDVVVAQSTLTFDMSVEQILVPLALGATVTIVDRSVILDAAELQRVCDTDGVTIVDATPSVFRALIDDGWKGGDHLTIWCGGEAMSPSLARQLTARSKRVWNSYGPTETTVSATFGEVTDGLTEHGGPIPLGAPIAGSALYVLDDLLEPLPPGFVGELVVGGAGVGRGYIGRPQLTAEKFVDDPFSPDPAGRMYRTGDLVRERSDGSLEFHGRIDDQVKIRGVRAELGEIEAALERHPGVVAAAAAVRSVGGSDHMVGYVVVSPDVDSVHPSAVIDSVRSWLPPAAVPSIVVTVDRLPMTTSGKIDRSLLPAPDSSRVPTSSFAPPTAGVESAIAEIWATVLGLDAVGRHDNFLELGGHSLLATKAASRLRRALGREVGVRDVLEHPTVAALARRIEDLERVDGTRIDIAEFTRPDGVYPLTFSQERMWFLHQLDPNSLAYNVTGALRIRGELHVDLLRQAIDHVVGRHAALRTTFEVQDGVPMQRVSDDAAVAFDVVDGGGARSSDGWERVSEWVENEARSGFDLEAGPLSRFVVYRIGSQEHLLFVSQHHIISDQWSIGILASEIVTAYEAFRAGGEPALDPVPFQLGPYAAWHRRLVENHRLDVDLDYWRRQLEGVPDLELPTDRPRPALKTSAGSTLHVDIDAGVMAAIDSFGRRVGATPFMIGLAAFQLTLARHSGVYDVAVGTAVANRNWFESEQVIGSLVNTVVMRTPVDENASFRELVDAVQQVALEAFAHQDMPFARLVSELPISRDPSRSPLFQAFFNVQNAPFEQPGIPGTRTEMVHLEQSAAQFDVSLSMNTINATASLEYNTDLFDHVRMRAFFDHFWTVLSGVLDHPDVPLRSISMVTPEERRAAAEWSLGPPLDADLSVPAHRLIENEVANRPDRIAVRFESDSVTYRELNARANRLARHLVALDCGPGDIVGISSERSVEMLIAVLGVLKSGAAYLPLDPGYPAARLALMAKDAAAKVIVTSGEIGELGFDTETIDLDAVDVSDLGDDDLDVEVSGDDVAYVIYTSGSTGTPKGVVIEHRNLVHYLHGAMRRPGMAQTDTVLAATSLSFDPSIHELLLPLLVGAQIVIVPRSTAIDGAALRRAVDEVCPTVMQATPTTWRMLVEAGWEGSTNLRIQCGGEAMTPDLAADLCARVDTVWNQYGPTETTLWATFHELDRSEDVDARTSSIQLGRPSANTTLLIVDEHLREVPAGVRGELCIGGGGVARGYLRRPELTDDAFTMLPDRPDAGRVYRTGDVVIRHLDGRLTFEGRTDHQVKLRGHRIELGEIEAAIDDMTEVVRSVVTVHTYAPGDERLVAYVTVRSGHGTPTPADVRAALASRLPAHMIPTVVVALDDFPRTTSDKIDRTRLPEPTTTVRSHGPVERPLPGTETLVASVWSDVLDIDDIGRHDDFFELGGHSLLAIRVFTKLERLLGEEMPLSVLYQAPTVSALAQFLTSQREETPFTSLVPIRPTGTATPLFYVSPFLVTVLSLSEIATHLPTDLPFYGLQPQGMETADPIHDRLEDIAAHYVSEMRAVQPSGPYRIGGHCSGSWVAFEMTRQLQAVGEEVADLILVDYGPPGQEPQRRRRLREVVDRLRYYARDGRLVPALRWQLGILRERLIVRRVGGERARRAAEVRARHAEAHARYRPESIEGDAVLVRSSESDELADRAWHLRWTDLISGSLRVEIVTSTHAGLVDNVNARELATAIGASIDA